MPKSMHNPTSIAITAALLIHGGQAGDDAIKKAVELHDEAYEYLEATGQLGEQLEDVSDEEPEPGTRKGGRKGSH